MAFVIGFDDFDHLEDELVEQAADMVWCFGVRATHVLRYIEGVGDESICFGEVSGGFFEFAVDAAEFPFEAALFCLEDVERDRVVVMCLEQLALLAFDILLACRELKVLDVAVCTDLLQRQAEK